MKKLLNVGAVLGVIAALAICYLIYNYAETSRRISNERLIRWQMSWMDRR